MKRYTFIALALIVSATACNRKKEQARIVEVPTERSADSAEAATPSETIVLTPTANLSPVPWRYTFETPAEDWFRPGFDDAPWPSGEGGFGNESTPGAFVGTVWITPDIWLRRSFVIQSLRLPPIVLMMHHDDDAEVYINGTLAQRVRGFTQSYREFQLSEESLKSLTVGSNLIAVHCHQFRLGQYIDAGLIARERPRPVTKAVTRIESETLPLPGIPLSPTADKSGVLWKFTTDTPPNGWIQPSFDDSKWDEGESGFGTTAPGAITRTEWKTPDIWLRRSFAITNLDLPPLELVMHHDEDAQVYLNGVLACGGVAFTAGYCEFPISDEAKRALVVGTNLMAVHCRQTFAGQFIDVGLFARDRTRRLPRKAASAAPIEAANEWPNFLGPTHDAVYHGPPLLENWPAEGPRQVWSKAIGEGRSSPVVGEGKLIVCHRQGEDLIVDCLNPQTGESHWSFRDVTAFRSGSASGPRPTPAIKSGKVFVHSNNGRLTCLNLDDGKQLWSQATREESGDATPLGSVSSPLVTDKAVILHVGGTDGSVVAFAIGTGEVLWKAFNDLPSMSSPVPVLLDGKVQVLLITRAFLRSFDPATGEPNWQYATHQQGSHTLFASTPVLSGNEVFLSGWHGLAARVLRVSDGDLESLWIRNDSLSTDFATPIVIDGYAYGYHGLEPNLSLRCVELETGEVKRALRKSSAGTLVRCGDSLLILNGDGELSLLRASPQNMSVKGKAQVLGPNSHTYPAVVDGYVYARDRKQIICLDLRGGK